MKTLWGFMGFFSILFLSGFMMNFLSPSIAFSSHAEPGWHFTDPNDLAPVPEDWSKKPIEYVSEDSGADIVISLDQHLYPMLLPVISDYAKKHKLKIIVNEGTCGISNGNLFRKQIDIGGYCCPAGKIDRLPGLRFHTLGISSLAIFVHPDNKTDNLTTEEVRWIYKGIMTRWSDVDAKNSELNIQPVTRLHCKLRPSGWRIILPNEDLFSANIYDVSSIPDMIEKVASNERAIGYEVAWNAMHRFSDKGKVKLVSIDGVSPLDNDALKEARYPFIRVYNITTWKYDKLKNRNAEKLVAYLREQIGDMDDKYGILPWFELQKNGWIFSDEELTGRPVK